MYAKYREIRKIIEGYQLGERKYTVDDISDLVQEAYDDMPISNMDYIALMTSISILNYLQESQNKT